MKYFLTLVFTLSLALLATFLINQKLNRRELPKYGTVAAFHLTDQDGEQFSSSGMGGKITVVNFFFTSCPKICPLVSEKVAKLRDKLDGDKNVMFLSISIDPETDTVEALKKYAARYRAETPVWRLLTGNMEVIKRILDDVSLDNGPEKGMHSTRLVLIDSEGVVRGYYPTDVEEEVTEKLAADVRLLSYQLK